MIHHVGGIEAVSGRYRMTCPVLHRAGGLKSSTNRYGRKLPVIHRTGGLMPPRRFRCVVIGSSFNRKKKIHFPLERKPLSGWKTVRPGQADRFHAVIASKNVCVSMIAVMKPASEKRRKQRRMSEVRPSREAPDLNPTGKLNSPTENTENRMASRTPALSLQRAGHPCKKPVP